MSSEVYERMRGNPKFRELVTKRGRFATVMTLAVLILFYGYVLVVAFSPLILGKPVRPGSMLTVGVAVELGLFVILWVLTGLYAHKANTEFDALTQQVVADARKEEK